MAEWGSAGEIWCSWHLLFAYDTALVVHLGKLDTEFGKVSEKKKTLFYGGKGKVMRCSRTGNIRDKSQLA